jgi:CRISPR-associated protein Cas6
MPVVDVSFRLLGRAVPADHGYELYSAMSRIVPALHAPAAANGWSAVAVHPINGTAAGGRRLLLRPTSRLTFRLDSDLIKDILPLAGKQLALGTDTVRVGVPTIYPLRPVARVRSRLVVIKGFMEPEPFMQACRYALEKLNIKGEPGLLRRRMGKALEGKTGDEADHSPFIRRTIRIHDEEVVGFAVEVQSLTAEESIRLQEHGIGGRRKFGCGVFVPVRG